MRESVFESAISTKPSRNSAASACHTSSPTSPRPSWASSTWQWTLSWPWNSKYGNEISTQKWLALRDGRKRKLTGLRSGRRLWVPVAATARHHCQMDPWVLSCPPHKPRQCYTRPHTHKPTCSKMWSAEQKDKQTFTFYFVVQCETFAICKNNFDKTADQMKLEDPQKHCTKLLFYLPSIHSFYSIWRLKSFKK